MSFDLYQQLYQSCRDYTKASISAFATIVINFSAIGFTAYGLSTGDLDSSLIMATTATAGGSAILFSDKISEMNKLEKKIDYLEQKLQNH